MSDRASSVKLKNDGGTEINPSTAENQLTMISSIDNLSGFISTDNASTTLLTNGSSYTWTWEDVWNYDSLIVAVKTDQNGTFTIQFSPDGTNIDSTLTRYYRTAQIEAPHRFTITRRYFRVVFTNNSWSDQTFFRLQCSIWVKQSLNAPVDSVLPQDFDAIVTRTTNYNSEVALGRRQWCSLWNKFWYNGNVSTAAPEVLASFWGTFSPLTTATTLTIVSTSTNDDGDPAGTWCNSIVIYWLDENRDEAIEVVTLNGTTNVVTTSEWLGINRVAMFLCWSGQTNAWTITITATTWGSTMAEMPAWDGVTQQCIFHVPRNHQFIMEWLRINSLRQWGGNDPILTIKVLVYSEVSNWIQEVYRVQMDTWINNNISENPTLPFPVTEKTVIWVEVETDRNLTEVSGRFSGILVRDVDA